MQRIIHTIKVIYIFYPTMRKSTRIIILLFGIISAALFSFIFESKKIAQKALIDTTRATIITQLTSLSNLETASMTMQKTVQGKQWLKDFLPNSTWDNLVQNFLFEDTLEMIIVAKFVWWFNLSKIDATAVQVHEDWTATLILPNAEVLWLSLTSDTKPLLRKRGVLNQWDIQMETDIRNQALEQMRKEAIEQWLLRAAEKNAFTIFSNILSPFWITLRDVVIQ